jgi:maltose O-acetyltransferase
LSEGDRSTVAVTSEKAKMLAGDPYDPFDPELVAERERARRLTRLFNGTDETDADRRRALLDELVGSTGDTVEIEPPFRCDYGYNLHVGDGFYANFDCVVLDVCPVRIGTDCLVGPGVQFYTATHPIDAELRADGLESGEPITVGDTVWLGGRAVINPGTTIGDRAVVASGAVVTGDVPDDVVVAGNPARVVREL